MITRQKHAVSATQRLAIEQCSRAWLSPKLVWVLQGYGARCCCEHDKIFTAQGYQTRSSCCWWRAATRKWLREEIDVGIEKWADLSHAIKNFGSRLDEAKTTHPELRNYKVVAHITNCLFSRHQEKKMSPGDIARSLMNTPRHFLVVMSPVVTSAKLLSSVILHSTGSWVSQGENLYRPGA